MVRRVAALSLFAALVMWVTVESGVAHRLRPARPPALPPEAAGPAPESPAGPAAVATPVAETHTVELRRGDTLVGALLAAGLDTGPAHAIAIALRGAGADLRKIRPGEIVRVTRVGGAVARVAYDPSPWVTYEAVADGDGWSGAAAEVAPEIRVEAVGGTVTRSLFHAMDEAGEGPMLTIELAEMFAYDFDFTLDTRPGDRFRMLVEKRYAGGRFVDYGRVLVAQYLPVAGRPLTGVGWARDSRPRWAYYDLEGRSLKKAFLRAPLEFTRITSGFTYRRPHPILGGVRPHLAVDYAAPVGTPVRAVADGVVRQAGWNGGNGISVTLKHRAGYQTMYNHLSRLARGLRPGARVRQRQVIGYVGSTGLSTGPHLDYRVSLNGKFLNPLSAKFLPGEPLGAGERPRFLAEARGLVSRLESAVPF